MKVPTLSDKEQLEDLTRAIEWMESVCADVNPVNLRQRRAESVRVRPTYGAAVCLMAMLQTGMRVQTAGEMISQLRIAIQSQHSPMAKRGD